MSSSPPWMPFNVGDYLRDTGHLTVVEHGAYLLLIMRYWQDGGLPDDEKLIARYAHLTAEQWSESKDVLVALFDEGWKHKRIDAELAKAIEIIGKRKTAGQQRQSTRSASAEQMVDTSSYTGVPPSPEQLPVQLPAPVPVAGARALFDELWSVFPQNPSSREAKAEAAFSATKAEDRDTILAAARRYRQWFTEDNTARERTETAGLRYVPHLSKWIEDGVWRDAANLAVKADPAAPVVPMVRVDRVLDADLFAACEAVRGKPTPTSPWSFTVDVVKAARQAMAEQSNSGAVH